MTMSSRAVAGRLLGLLAAVLGLLLVAQPGAYAGSRTVRDTTDDAYALTGADPTRQPGATGDVVSVTTQHRPAKVVVTVRLRDLPTALNMVQLNVKTSNPDKRYFVVGSTSSRRDVFRISTFAKGARSLDSIVRCTGLHGSLRPAADLVRVVIPRSCIDTPRWVRTGAAVITGWMLDAPGPDVAAPPATIDIAGVDTLSAAYLASHVPKLPLGPKVRVG